MPKGVNNIDTKSDEQFLSIKATIESHKQESDKNQMKNNEKLTLLKRTRRIIMRHSFFSSFFLSFGPASKVPTLTHYGMV